MADKRPPLLTHYSLLQPEGLGQTTVIMRSLVKWRSLFLKI
ncbi:hypothetical protein [Pleurocapsa sp. PCC 7319]|nr:hypothetical protein [Pleurocapsa sp. PCC 7319]